MREFFPRPDLANPARVGKSRSRGVRLAQVTSSSSRRATSSSPLRTLAQA